MRSGKHLLWTRLWAINSVTISRVCRSFDNFSAFGNRHSTEIIMFLLTQQCVNWANGLHFKCKCLLSNKRFKLQKLGYTWRLALHVYLSRDSCVHICFMNHTAAGCQVHMETRLPKRNARDPARYLVQPPTGVRMARRRQNRLESTCCSDSDGGTHLQMCPRQCCADRQASAQCSDPGTRVQMCPRHARSRNRHKLLGAVLGDKAVAR